MPKKNKFNGAPCAYFDGLYQYFNVHYRDFHADVRYNETNKWNGPCVPHYFIFRLKTSVRNIKLTCRDLTVKSNIYWLDWMIFIWYSIMEIGMELCHLSTHTKIWKRWRLFNQTSCKYWFILVPRYSTRTSTSDSIWLWQAFTL